MGSVAAAKEDLGRAGPITARYLENSHDTEIMLAGGVILF
jgi:hypothetical protein